MTKCTDQEETEEVQESRIEHFKKEGDLQFTEDGHSAGVTVDLVLQARTKLSDNKVNGPEDAVMSEIVKKLPRKRFTLLRGAFRNVS